MITNAPFTDEQVKSINTFQRLSDSGFHPLTCKCGSEMFATNEGLTCRKCLSKQDFVPLFIANGSWNIFRKKESDDGIVKSSNASR